MEKKHKMSNGMMMSDKKMKSMMGEDKSLSRTKKRQQRRGNLKQYR